MVIDIRSGGRLSSFENLIEAIMVQRPRWQHSRCCCDGLLATRTYNRIACPKLLGTSQAHGGLNFEIVTVWSQVDDRHLNRIPKWANAYQTDMKLADLLVWSTSDLWSLGLRSIVQLSASCSTVRSTKGGAHLLLSDTCAPHTLILSLGQNDGVARTSD